MFVQLIQGSTSDPQGLRRQVERWRAEIRPGAEGFLGSTAGVAADGTVFVAARFASEAAARANSDRPEQAAWWAETEKYFDGPVRFVDSSDVEVHIEPRHDAGFVQVIRSRALDPARLRAVNAQTAPVLSQVRPEIVGAVSVWDGDRVVDIAYFSSEAEARAGEAREVPEAQRSLLEEWRSLMDDVSFIDLPDPWIV